MSAMLPTLSLSIHESRFPGRVRAALLTSLRTRNLDPKFLYDGVRQTRRWLRLHQEWSPYSNDPACQDIYERAFGQAARLVAGRDVTVAGLGCGGGEKDTALLRRLRSVSLSRRLAYVPCDVSAAMVTAATTTANEALRLEACRAFVCDLLECPDLPERLAELCSPGTSRILTFFGMLPNFDPGAVLPQLAASMNDADFLLVSANLIPGNDPGLALDRILPQYDNELTRDWLFGFLVELGFERGHGVLRFTVAKGREVKGARRIEARFELTRKTELRVEGESFEFEKGASIRVFFSWRYTVTGARDVLAEHRLPPDAEWVADSGEEAVFLCRKPREELKCV